MQCCVDGVPATSSLRGPLTWLWTPGGGVQVGKFISAGNETSGSLGGRVSVCVLGVGELLGSGRTFTDSVLLVILDSVLGLPAWAAAAGV